MNPNRAPTVPPRAGLGGLKPGTYEVVARLSRQLVDPGDMLEVELLITGYGAIEASKLLFFPSPGLIDQSESEATFNLRIDSDGQPVWGGQTSPVQDSFIIELSGGMQAPTWPAPTLFFDAHQGRPSLAPTIATETMAKGVAPVELSLRIRDDVRPGLYGFRIVFSYYNSSEWRSSIQDVQFTVRNLLQRREIMIATLALIAAVVTIVPGIADSISAIWSIFTK